MAGFNFGSIAATVNRYMDTDAIDICRAELITLPDGSISVSDANTPLYADVPCHVSFGAIDSPDVAEPGADPVLILVTINCAVNVDLQNKDYIRARKLSHDGSVFETYVGTVGMPVTDQARKSATMLARRIT